MTATEAGTAAGLRVAVGSVKGAPGATTFALALAACWPAPGAVPRVVLAEADPAGGDLGGRFGVADVPGLAGLAVAARHDTGPGLWQAYAQRLRVGAEVVVAPASGRQAAAAVAALAELAPRLPSDVDLVWDVGRWYPGSPAWSMAVAADEVLVVCGASDAAIDHTAAFTAGHPLAARMSVVLVGQTRFREPELAAAFGVPVAVRVPVDRRGAAVLGGSARPRRGWSRIGVAAAARTVALAMHRRRATPGVLARTPVPAVLAPTRDGAR